MTDLCACGCGERVPPPLVRRGKHSRQYVNVAHRERAAYLRRVPTYTAKRPAYKPRLENKAYPSVGKCMVEMGVLTISESNTREHWAPKADRVAAQRQAVIFCLKVAREHVDKSAVRRVTFQRCGGARKLDYPVNLSAAFKHVQDAVAEWLGVTDAPSGPVKWVVDEFQDQAAPQGIRITFES